MTADREQSGYMKDETHPDTLLRLRLAVDRFEEIRGSRLFKEGKVESHPKLRFENGKVINESVAAPWEDVRSIATLLRPYSIADLSVKRLSSLGARDVGQEGLARWFTLAGLRYDALMRHPMSIVELVFFGHDKTMWTPGRIFDAYMYSSVAHVDLSKVSDLRRFGVMEPFIRSVFIGCCVALVMDCIQLFADNASVSLGLRDAPQIALDGPSKNMWDETVKRVKEADEFAGATYPDSRLPGVLITTEEPT